jgi:hypothetical protein
VKAITTSLYTKGGWLNTLARPLVRAIYATVGFVYSYLFRKYSLPTFNSNLTVCTSEEAKMMPLDVIVQGPDEEYASLYLCEVILPGSDFRVFHISVRF